MIRVHLMSDVHLEFGPLELPEAVRSGELAELVLLAGDVHTKRRAVPWAAETFSQRVALVGGNHEGYGDYLWASIAAARDQAAEASRSRAADAEIRHLERETMSFIARDGTPVRVLGCTLWTDFALLPDELVEAAMDRALMRSNDYQWIKLRSEPGDKALFRPEVALDIHRQSVAWLDAEMASPWDGVTIVMTHHAPHPDSVKGEYAYPTIAPLYGSNLARLIERRSPHLWVHGHVHETSDYMVGTTRIVANPRGYVMFGGENPRFEPDLVLEVAA